MVLPNNIATADAALYVASLADASVDLTFFSPPYDKLRRYNGAYESSPTTAASLATDLYRVTKDGGWCVLVMADASDGKFCKTGTTRRTEQAYIDAGWKHFQTCIYARKGTPGRWWAHRMKEDHEYIIMFFKGKRPKVFNKRELYINNPTGGQKSSVKHRNTRDENDAFYPKEKFVVPEMGCRGTIWYYPKEPKVDKVKYSRSGVMPNALASDVIKLCTNEGDLVLDPMMGAGTTVIEALKLKRKYLGCDIDPESLRIVKERLENLNVTSN